MQATLLEGGYHDAITFNDNAVSESAETLTDVFEAKGDYAFVPADLRKLAGENVLRILGDAESVAARASV